ncbi:MAG TPA: 4Fe-4S dicluster domain-containing protein [Phycisphaerae bacterium]|nr:4Fe-4S dicluster domain-containing protein [Phycisphaerae bacterium]
MQWLRPFKPLRGGYFLHDESLDAGHRDFRPLPGGPPRVLHVPLANGPETPADLLVHEGAEVTAGQLIARSASGVGVHAALSGVVRAQSQVATPYGEHVPATTIEVAADAEDRPGELFEGQLDVPPANVEAFVQRMRVAGANAGDLEGFAAGAAPKALIVCGLDSSPPLTSRTQMLFRYGAIVIETASLIHRLFGFYRTYLAVERGHATLVRLCTRRSRGTPVRVADLVNRYPQADPRMLVRTILGRALRPGQHPRDAGVVVVDVGDIVDFARALRGEAVTHRLVSIAGHGVREPGNYRVPIGTPVADVLRAVGAGGTRQVVFDCLISGPAVTNLATVVTQRTTAILPLWPADPPNPSPCIRCGLCQDVCPVELDPLAFYQWRGRRSVERLHPQACLACGLCDYVCPTELPLMSRVRSGDDVSA